MAKSGMEMLVGLLGGVIVLAYSPVALTVAPGPSEPSSHFIGLPWPLVEKGTCMHLKIHHFQNNYQSCLLREAIRYDLMSASYVYSFQYGAMMHIQRAIAFASVT